MGNLNEEQFEQLMRERVLQAAGPTRASQSGGASQSAQSGGAFQPASRPQKRPTLSDWDLLDEAIATELRFAPKGETCVSLRKRTRVLQRHRAATMGSGIVEQFGGGASEPAQSGGASEPDQSGSAFQPASRSQKQPAGSVWELLAEGPDTSTLTPKPPSQPPTLREIVLQAKPPSQEYTLRVTVLPEPPSQAQVGGPDTGTLAPKPPSQAPTLREMVI